MRLDLAYGIERSVDLVEAPVQPRQSEVADFVAGGAERFPICVCAV